MSYLPSSFRKERLEVLCTMEGRTLTVTVMDQPECFPLSGSFYAKSGFLLRSVASVEIVPGRGLLYICGNRANNDYCRTDSRTFDTEEEMLRYVEKLQKAVDEYNEQHQPPKPKADFSFWNTIKEV